MKSLNRKVFSSKKILDFTLVWQALLLIILVAVPGCSLFDDDFEGQVTVNTFASQLIISNHTSEVVYYDVFPRGMIEVMFWVPCINPARCAKKIQPERRVVISYQDILRSGTDDDEVVVYWWHLVEKQDGEYTFDPLREIVVKL